MVDDNPHALRGRPLANQMVPSHLEPVAYVHNYVQPDEPGRWAGIGEIYEHSLDTARGRGAWFESEEARPLVEQLESMARELLGLTGGLSLETLRNQAAAAG